MREVAIRKIDDKWQAFDGEKKVGGSACRSCIINVMLKLTAKSTVYNIISVYDEKGEIEATYRTGIARTDDAGNDQEASS